MSRYTFTKRPDSSNPYDVSTISFSVEVEDRTLLLEAFRDFLAACGFSVQHKALVLEGDEQTEEVE